MPRFRLSARSKKRLASAIAIIVLLFILTAPKWHYGRPDIDLNATSDYYEIYYGNRTSAGVKEAWVEFHSPTDLFAYYYCDKREGLQIGAFVLGEENITAQEDGKGDDSGLADSSSDGIDVLGKSMGSCLGLVSPIPVTGELNPYETGLRVCYGLRLVESRSCVYS